MDACGCVNKTIGIESQPQLLHIQAWASALLSDFDKAMREASDGRTVTDTDSYAFLSPKPLNANERMTAATNHIMQKNYSLTKRVLLAAAALSPALLAYGGLTVGGEVDGLRYFITSSTTVMLCGFSGSAESVVSVEIPSSVTILVDDKPWIFKVNEIDGYAFAKCRNLTSVEIPNSVTSIGGWAFHECSSLTSISIPNSIKYIDTQTFYDCTSLTSVEIPNSVIYIAEAAFNGCSSLTSVEIPNSVTTIKEAAFGRCSSLTSVEIPASVTNIYHGAFADCSSLIEIKVLNMIPPTVEDTLDYSGTIYRAATLYVPRGAVELYKRTAPWSNFYNIVGIEVDESAIADVEVADVEAPAEYYNLRGARINGDALAPGVYIKRQGGCATKVLIQ